MAAASGLVLRRFDDLETFEARALPYLLKREAEHNLFLGICSQIRDGRYPEAYLAAVERDGEVVAAAFRTPPHQLGLSHVEDADAIGLIAEDARAAFDSLPGVLGGKADARAFAELWSEISGRTSKPGLNQRVYQATECTAPIGVRGTMRDATARDRELLLGWLQAMQDEVGAIVGSPEEAVDYRLSAEATGLVLWWDDGPVSVSGFGGRTPNGSRLGPVFTPPELRRRGYATACVAALTRRLLDEGRRFVFLYTDLANPTSNSIYQKIGYRPVCDVDQYLFV